MNQVLDRLVIIIATFYANWHDNDLLKIPKNDIDCNNSILAHPSGGPGVVVLIYLMYGYEDVPPKNKPILKFNP